MAHIYIALVDTPGIFAAVIRSFLKQRYVHVVLSADAGLLEAYSVGRRNPAVPGLPFLAMGQAFFIKNQYTCSSYAAKILEENGIRIADKHFSLVTPKDFYEYDGMRVVFEGPLSDLVPEIAYG